MVRICVRKTLTLVSFTHLILVSMYVAPPMRMVRGQWQVCYGSGLSIIIIVVQF